MLKEIRKKELPPVDSSLLLNVDLMLSLADELNVSAQEKSKIDSMLHENGGNLFLVDSIDCNLWTNTKNLDNYSKVVQFDGKTITLSANMICTDSVIQVKVNNNGPVVKNWTVDKVKRKGDTVNEFLVSLTSKDLKYKFNDGDIISLSILPYGDLFKEIIYNFKVKKNFLSYDFELDYLKERRKITI